MGKASNPRSGQPPQAGFTLLEILVAIGIFALFSAMAYGSLLRILDTRDRLENERDYWRGLTLSLMQIDEDLAHARARPVRNPMGLPQNEPAFSGQPVDTRSLGKPSLEFTRGGQTVLGDGARSDLQRIGYRLRDRTLERLVWPALDRAPTSEPQVYPLLEDVEAVSLRFYAPAAGWVDYWPPMQAGAVTSPDPLPAGVEIRLKMQDRGEILRIFRVNG